MRLFWRSASSEVMSSVSKVFAVRSSLYKRDPSASYWGLPNVAATLGGEEVRVSIFVYFHIQLRFHLPENVICFILQIAVRQSDGIRRVTRHNGLLCDGRGQIFAVQTSPFKKWT